MRLRSRKTLRTAVSCALFAVGFLLAFLLPEREEMPGPPTEPDRSPSVPREEPSRERPSVPEERFREAFQSLRSALGGEGQLGSITGRVVTPDGAPVAGIQITVVPDGDRLSSSEPAGERTLEEEIIGFLSRFRTGWRSARTDENGEFRVEDLRAGGRYRVEASRYRYKISAAPGSDPGRVRVGQHVIFIAEPPKLYQVRIACVLPDGTVPPEVEIIPQCPVDPNLTDPHFTWTPEEPIASFLCPSVELSASCSIGAREFRSDPLEVAGGEYGRPSVATIQLKSVPGIKGKVVFPQGQRLRGWDEVFVCAVPVAEPVRPPPGVTWPQGATDASSSPSPEGYDFYRLCDLKPGLYWVHVRPSQDSESLFAEAFVEVRGEMEVRDFFVEPIAAERSVRLWAWGPGRTALQDLSVSFCSKADTALPAFHLFQEGAYLWIAGIPTRVLEQPAGPWVLRLKSLRYGVREFPFDPARDRELRVEFAQPAILWVEIDGFSGSAYQEQPAELAVLLPGSVDPESPDARAVAREFVEPTGLAVFLGLAPGDYELSFRFSPTDGIGWTEVARAAVRASPGLNRVRLVAPPLYEIGVRIPSKMPRSPVWIRRKGGGFGTPLAGEPGERVVFGGLPAGDYVLGARDREIEFSLPGTRELDFGVEARRGLEVTIADRAGYLAQVGLATGDLIVGIDGAEFSRSEDIQLSLGAALERDSIELDVLRGDRRVRVRVDPKKLVRPELLGGRLLPVSR